jgi:glycerol-3-phosphate dehydrogenase
VVGTTDTPVAEVKLEPRALEEEIDFILKHAATYLTKDPTRADVRSVFAGLRPLVKTGEAKSTAAISRDHYLVISESGLVTITGGKWTTYRKMAEDTMNQALLVAGLDERECVTKNLRIHGWLKNFDRHNPLHFYGTDAVYIEKLMNLNPAWAQPLHPALPYTGAEVIWAIREEMARSVEDVLARRSRALQLDARAAIEMAPAAARLMAEELGYDAAWQKQQVRQFIELAGEYLLA